MFTPEIIDQIDELILEDRRISTKSIAGQLVINNDFYEFYIIGLKVTILDGNMLPE